MKPLNSMSCSRRIICLVQKIKLKPMKKKIVGGRMCFISSTYQARARRQKDGFAPVGTAIIAMVALAPSRPGASLARVDARPERYGRADLKGSSRRLLASWNARAARGPSIVSDRKGKC